MEVSQTGLLPESLVLGLPEVDRQHEGVFCRIETLKFTCIAENALSQPLVDDLLHYLTEHFATEEMLATAANLDFGDHAASHQHTLSILRRWTAKLMAGELDVFSFLRYLEIWFERHILHEDQPFARELLASKRAFGG